MPAPAVADVRVPDACAHGTSSAPEWWDCLPRSPEWHAERAGYLRDRLAKHLGLALDPDRIDCRTRCCRLRLSNDQYRATSYELSSSVGLRIGPTDGYMANKAQNADEIEVMTCWKQGPIDDFPDRAIERDELVAAVKPDLESCARGLAQPTTLALMLWLDEQGEISAITGMDTEEPGQVPGVDTVDPTRVCVEAALRRGAVFEPPADTMSRKVPVHVRLPP